MRGILANQNNFFLEQQAAVKFYQVFDIDRVEKTAERRAKAIDAIKHAACLRGCTEKGIDLE